MRTFIPKGAKLLPKDAERVFKGVIFDVYQWQQKLFDGSSTIFEMLKRPDTVKVIPVKEGKLLVQEQEQPTLGFFFDFPGGRHDVEAETELEGAQRELLEETGMRFKTWKLLGVKQPEVKIDWLKYTFIATDFIDQKEQKLDAGEKIKNTWKDFEEVKELLKNPEARYLARDIFEKINSLEELFSIPDLYGKK